VGDSQRSEGGNGFKVGGGGGGGKVGVGTRRGGESEPHRRAPGGDERIRGVERENGGVREDGGWIVW